MPTPIHICIVTTAHSFDDVRVNKKIAVAFLRAGFHVTWIGPGHACFETEYENQDGIDFRFGPPIRTRIDRVLAAKRIRRLSLTMTAVDVYYAPDPDSAPIALELAKRDGARVIFDIHEVFHGALLDRWFGGRRLNWVREWVRRRIARCCKQCDLVMGVSDAVLEPYLESQAQRLVVRSCAPAWFADGPAADVCKAGKTCFTVMHGKAGLLRGTSIVLDALARAAREVKRLRAVMFTSGEPIPSPEGRQVFTRAKELGIAQVLDLRKGVPMRSMPDILRLCDVGLIAYGRDLGVDSLPNRLFEFMAVGIPIIAPVYAREIANIIDTEQCGVLVDFEDPAAIGDAIVRLQRNPTECRAMGLRGREAFLARHNWEVEVRPLIEIILNWFPGRQTTAVKS